MAPHFLPIAFLPIGVILLSHERDSRFHGVGAMRSGGVLCV